MTLNKFRDYSNVMKPDQIVTSDSVIPISYVPKPDLDGFVSWSDNPIPPNRTFLGLGDHDIKERNIHPLTYIHKDFCHPYYPNYKRMELNNRGLWEPNGDEIKKRVRSRDNWYVRNAIMSQLELTDAQKQRAMYLAGTRQVRSAVNGFSLIEATYCLCGIVCWEDRRKTHPCSKNLDEIFEAMVKKLRLQKSRIYKIWGRLFNALDGMLKKPAAR